MLEPTLVLPRPTPGGHRLKMLHQGIKGGSNPAYWSHQPLPLRRMSLTWRRRTLGQKTSAPLRLKTETRQASQSTPPKQNDIAQNITMDAAGSSSGSRFEVCSVGHKHGVSSLPARAGITEQVLGSIPNF